MMRCEESVCNERNMLHLPILFIIICYNEIHKDWVLLLDV